MFYTCSGVQCMQLFWCIQLYTPGSQATRFYIFNSSPDIGRLVYTCKVTKRSQTQVLRD